MSKGINTYIILAIAAAALLLSGGILGEMIDEAPMEEGLNILQRIRRLLSDMISQGVTVTRDLNIEGSLEYEGKFEFDDIAPERVELSYHPDKMNITADGKQVSVEGDEATLSLGDYRGLFSADQKNLSIEGEASSISTGPITIDGDATEISAQGEYRKVSLEELKLSELEVGEVTGSLNLGSSASLELEKSPLLLHAFLGSIELDDRLIGIEGKVSRASIGNKTVSGGTRGY